MLRQECSYKKYIDAQKKPKSKEKIKLKVAN